MTRVAVIGNAGGGKSTLARKLGNALSLPFYEVDQVQWKPGWVHTSPEELVKVYNEWMATPRWIIDGWGSWDALAIRFQKSDTIILVDFPIALHYWWTIKRQVTCLFESNPLWPPPGCQALPITGRLLKRMWEIHRLYRPKLLKLIDQYREQKNVIDIRSRREMKQFIATHCQPRN